MTEIKYLYNNQIADLSARTSIESLDTRVEALEQGGGSSGDISDLIGLGEEITFTRSAYIANAPGNLAASVASPTSSGSWDYAVVDCSEGNKFYIAGNSASSGVNCYYFTDSSYSILETNEVFRFRGNIIAPAGATKLIINRLHSNTNKSYTGENKIEDVTIDDGTFIVPGKDNVGWSWWIYPLAVAFNRIRNKVYFGFTNADGYIGVASHDVETGETVKNLLRKSSRIDEHNAAAVYIYEDGTILCAYSGHQEDNYIRVRVSTVPESIELFGKTTCILSSGGTAYAQLIFYDNKLYLFYRVDTKNWAYRYTPDKGKSWSNEVMLVTSSVQYYCRFMPTTTDGIVRVIMYSNPGKGDPAIRQAFLHLDTGMLYDSDNSTSLGTNNVSKDDVTTIIPVPTGYTSQRLLDVAVTAVNRPMVIFAPFSNATNADYKLYDAGTTVEIVAGGVSLNSSYYLGASFVDDSQIIVARADSTNDIVDLYTYSGGTVTLGENLYTEARGSIPIRNYRPMVVGGHAIWLRGYYGNSYSKFNADAMIVDLSANT